MSDSQVTHFDSNNYKGELYNKVRHSQEAFSAFMLIEPSLLKQDWPEALRLLKHIAAVLGVPSVLHPAMSIDFSEKLLGYSFPELIVADEELKDRFRARWSFVQLLASSLISPGHWLVEWELIAVLLGRDYDVVLNPVQIHAEGFNNRPEM